MIFSGGEWAPPAGEGVFHDWVPLEDLSLGREGEFQECLTLPQLFLKCLQPQRIIIPK